VEAEAAGGLRQSSHYAHHLALQLKARLEDLPPPVYGPQPLHHLSRLCITQK